jgi:hypothetical protein
LTNPEGEATVATIPLRSLNVTSIKYNQHISKTAHMVQIIIDFDWRRDPLGYHLIEEQRSFLVRRNGKGHAPEDTEHYRPLSGTDALFKIFVNMATTPERVLEFVRRFGSLTWEGWDATKGDRVDVVLHNARFMQQALRFSTVDQNVPARCGLGPSALMAAVVWDPATQRPKWELRPNTLLDALWLQLGQALTGGSKFRQCEHCGNWFEAGQGTGRRLDSKFCSDGHRIAFNSLKRSREK